ncbi:MAG TPA: glutathione S-transferase [Rhodospirillaceae bacterium]|nr:glutathione S-transferase [Rhodospirillaceae bacterium]HAA92863.1 glutathione S-transferase [Rhodospirillaceae bacterium]HAT36658.1 glutathione S-transferase [Rhodospirillaceae bacterium]|tara:strand:- start:148 stop:765 length:618 start_codon:yes stop_codon:yes gene_type:complete
MLKIWGRKTSSNVRKVLWCADELGVEFEREDVGGDFGGNDEQWYLDMNPNGLVPTIEDDGMILWESNAIIRYLCCKHDQGGMYPADIQERAEAEKWMDWHLTVAVPKTGPIFRGIVHTPEDQRDHAAMKECGEELTRIYQFVEKRLEGRDYIMGDRFTMVDCALGVHVNRYYVLVEERPAFKYMDAWYERLKARPPFDTHVTICP